MWKGLDGANIWSTRVRRALQGPDMDLMVGSDRLNSGCRSCGSPLDLLTGGTSAKTRL